ncbi:YbaN family protein [Roseobacter sp. YSTF-M11]|uniref:YbaN family protein n=2 Tax=Roseobacter insulae TaxID=2859783 RepID=A0A9X1FU05_9RHOB|nr:YbaN family protein [Roseobacter insulae]
MPVPGLWRPIWFGIGIAALIAGAIGAVLPILPTSPFVILAAFAFGKSSPRLKSWLEQNSVFGPMIAEWQQYGAIAPRYKAMALVMMAAALGLSVALDVRGTILIVQAVCMTLAAGFILTRPGGPE